MSRLSTPQGMDPALRDAVKTRLKQRLREKIAARMGASAPISPRMTDAELAASGQRAERDRSTPQQASRPALDRMAAEGRIAQQADSAGRRWLPPSPEPGEPAMTGNVPTWFARSIEQQRQRDELDRPVLEAMASVTPQQVADFRANVGYQGGDVSNLDDRAVARMVAEQRVYPQGVMRPAMGGDPNASIVPIPPVRQFAEGVIGGAGAGLAAPVRLAALGMDALGMDETAQATHRVLDEAQGRAQGRTGDGVVGAAGTVVGNVGPMLAGGLAGVPLRTLVTAGAVQGAAGGVEEARAGGADTGDQALAAVGYGLLEAGAESIGLGKAVRFGRRIAARIGRAAQAGDQATVRALIGDALETAAVNAGEEAATKLGQNVAARDVIGFDPDRSRTEGVGEAAATGAAVGPLAAGAGVVAGRLQRIRGRGVAAANEGGLTDAQDANRPVENPDAPVAPGVAAGGIEAATAAEASGQAAQAAGSPRPSPPTAPSTTYAELMRAASAVLRPEVDAGRLAPEKARAAAQAVAKELRSREGGGVGEVDVRAELVRRGTIAKPKFEELPQAIGDQRLRKGLRSALDVPEHAGRLLRDLAEKRQAGKISGEDRSGIVYRAVDPAEEAVFRERFGLTTKGFVHVATVDGIQHALKRHSNPKIELSRGQNALTLDDIARIPEITKPEYAVAREKGDSGHPVIRYERMYEDGTTLIVEEYRSGQRQLAFLSMRKIKNKGAGDQSSRASVRPESPISQTPETTGGVPPAALTEDSGALGESDARARLLPVPESSTVADGGPKPAAGPSTTSIDAAAPTVKENLTVPPEDEGPITELGQGGQDARRRPPSSPRIDVDPIPGRQPKSPGDISLDLQKGLGIKVRRGKPSRGAIGTFYPGSAKTVVRFANDLDTTAHEVAHRLDDLYSIVGKWAGKRVRSPFDGELIPRFSDHGSPGKTLTYKRAEGVAEWVRAWIVNPKAAEAAAPKFAAHFEQTVPQAVRDRLRAFGDDIRAYKGATGVQKTLANVRMKPTRSRLVESMLELVGKDDGPDFKTNTIGDRVIRSMVDANAPVWKAIKFARELRGVSDVLPRRDPKLLIRLWEGFGGKYQDVIENGPIFASGERVPDMGGLEWLTEPLDRSSAENLERDQGLVAAYLINQRVIEKARQFERSSGISGAGAGIESDVSVARQARKELARMPKERLAQIREGAKRYRQFADTVLAYARDKGRITDEQYKAVRDSNRFYVSFKRVMEDQFGDAPSFGAGSRKLGTAKKVMERMTGSGRQIENPYVSLLGDAYRIMREADRNEAMLRFTDELNQTRAMYQGRQIDLDQIGSMAKQGDDNAVKVWREGEVEYWQFEENIHKAIKGMGAGDPTDWVSTVGMTLARIKRAGIVLDPAFFTRNMLRDALSRSIVSEHGSKPWDTAYYLVHPKEFRQDLSDFRRAGGALFGHFGIAPKDYYRILSTHNRAITKSGHILATPRSIYDGYTGFMEKSEIVGRLAEYRRAYDKARKDGMSEIDADLYAAAQARDLADYAVAGTFIRWLNRYVPFTNAAMQNLARGVRGARSNPAQFTARLAMYTLPMTFAVRALVSLMGDEEEYKQLPAYQRDFYWNIKVGPDTWLTIPKPFEFGVAATAADRMIDVAQGDPIERAFDGYGKSVLHSASPVDEQSFIGPHLPLIEAMANKDFFRDRAIVPPYEAELALELRKNKDRASRVGKLIGDTVGVDGRYIDHLFGGFGGTLGRRATQASDLGRDDVEGEWRRAIMSASGLVRSSPVSAYKDVEWVMTHLREQGKTSSSQYRQMRDLMDAYYSAETAEQRDAATQRLRERAADIRKSME